MKRIVQNKIDPRRYFVKNVLFFRYFPPEVVFDFDTASKLYRYFLTVTGQNSKILPSLRLEATFIGFISGKAIEY